VLWCSHGLHTLVIIYTVPNDTGGASTKAVVTAAENDDKRAWSLVDPGMPHDARKPVDSVTMVDPQWTTSEEVGAEPSSELTGREVSEGGRAPLNCGFSGSDALCFGVRVVLLS